MPFSWMNLKKGIAFGFGHAAIRRLALFSEAMLGKEKVGVKRSIQKRRKMIRQVRMFKYLFI